MRNLGGVTPTLGLNLPTCYWRAQGRLHFIYIAGHTRSHRACSSRPYAQTERRRGMLMTHTRRRITLQQQPPANARWPPWALRALTHLSPQAHCKAGASCPWLRASRGPEGHRVTLLANSRAGGRCWDIRFRIWCQQLLPYTVSQQPIHRGSSAPLLQRARLFTRMWPVTATLYVPSGEPPGISTLRPAHGTPTLGHLMAGGECRGVP